MVAPRKRDAEQCDRQQTPLVGTLDNEQTKDEEQADDGTHIDGTCGERLIAPIEGHTLAELFGRLARNAFSNHILVEVGLLAQRVVGRTAHIIRNQECPRLTDAIAPRRGIVEVETLGLVLGVGRLLEVGVSTAHRLFGIFEVGENSCRTRSQADAKGCCKKQCGQSECLPGLGGDGQTKFGNPKSSDDEAHIVRHLGMREETDGRAQEGEDDARLPMPVEDEIEARHYSRHKCQR